MASRRPKSVPPETNVYSVKKEKTNKTFKDSAKDVHVKKDQGSCGNIFKEIQCKTTVQSEKRARSKSAGPRCGAVKKSGKPFDLQVTLQKKVTSLKHFS